MSPLLRSSIRLCSQWPHQLFVAKHPLGAVSGTYLPRAFMKTGIIGMPNVGKSTLFNALVGERKAAASNFPFCTIEPNHGRIAVPDARLGTFCC